MPIKKCSQDGKPGWKWGDEGSCYTYDPNSPGGSATAKAKAVKQAVAIQHNKPKKQRMDGQVQI